MDELEKHKDTSSMLRQASWNISKPSVNSNWSYSPNTLKSDRNWQFVVRVTLKFDEWPCKTTGHLFYATSSVVHHFITTSYGPEMPKLGQEFFFTSVTLTFELWPWPFGRASLLPMVITPENFMIIRQEHCHRQTETNKRTNGQNCSFSCLVAATNQV